jgi:hypothetical protein
VAETDPSSITRPDATLRDLQTVLLAIKRDQASGLVKIDKTDAATEATLRQAIRTLTAQRHRHRHAGHRDWHAQAGA